MTGNGRRKSSRCLGKLQSGVVGMREWVEWCSVATTLFANLEVSSSLCKFVGCIPASSGTCKMGFGLRHPLVMNMVSFRTPSNLLAFLLRHHLGAAYSTAPSTTSKELVQIVYVFVPQDVLARHLSRQFLIEMLKRRPSRCWR